MTPTMFQKRIYGYSETEQIQVLHLPYKGKRLEMVVLLPKEKDGLAKLEQSLTAKNLKAWLKPASFREVKVYLPKFKLHSDFSMAGTFRDLGMTLPFTKGAADFSGMNGHRNLYISAVMHKAFVDVNERGTEAAAATGVAVTITSLQPKPVVFRADHPFLFLIRDKQTGSILFMGRLTDPGK